MAKRIKPKKPTTKTRPIIGTDKRMEPPSTSPSIPSTRAGSNPYRIKAISTGEEEG